MFAYLVLLSLIISGIVIFIGCGGENNTRKQQIQIKKKQLII